MSRKGENIYKRKDGRWEGRYLKQTVDGKRCYGYIYASTYRDARVRLRNAAELYASNLSHSSKEETLLSAVAARWEQNIVQQVKESTFVKYHTIINNHILPVLGNTPVEAMTHEKIEYLVLQLMNNGGRYGAPLSPRTVSDILSVLRSILRFARRYGAVVPCDGSSVKVRQKPAEIRVLTCYEQEKLCQYIYENISLRNVGILLSLYTGLRVGEICALQWEDINLNERLLYVRHSMQRIQNLETTEKRTRIIVSTPKSISSSRAIPLPESLAHLIESLPSEKNGYFLTGQKNNFVEPRTMQYHFRRVLEHCGIENVNYHALRHTFATRCVELGFDVKSLSELLGHSTVTMTMERYVHPSMAHKRENMQRLSSLINLSINDGVLDG